jgi:hypothetical protein
MKLVDHRKQMLQNIGASESDGWMVAGGGSLNTCKRKKIS